MSFRFTTEVLERQYAQRSLDTPVLQVYGVTHTTGDSSYTLKITYLQLDEEKGIYSSEVLKGSEVVSTARIVARKDINYRRIFELIAEEYPVSPLKICIA